METRKSNKEYKDISRKGKRFRKLCVECPNESKMFSRCQDCRNKRSQRYKDSVANKKPTVLKPELWAALEESIKFQSHYAELLNMSNIGYRLIFANAQEWIDRLRSLKNEG